ncbi:excisionase [Burkholderia glumae AU6208]|nr:excisionase [Burkholderia glumae AU6208]
MAHFSVSCSVYRWPPLVAAITRRSQNAIRRKIEDGKWIDGREFRRASAGVIFASMKGFA